MSRPMIRSGQWSQTTLLCVEYDRNYDQYNRESPCRDCGRHTSLTRWVVKLPAKSGMMFCEPNGC